VIALWAVVGYLGSQHFHEIFQQPAETASTQEAPAAETPVAEAPAKGASN